MDPLRITLQAPVERTPRVMQVASMLDVDPDTKTASEWTHCLPLDEKSWQVGLVVGPSGAGKSVLARHLWPDSIVPDFDWAPDRALVDGFPSALSIREVTGLLTSVGLSSVPAWLRPFGTLSNGEAFRASIARALAEMPDLLVVDEFTSVVDRQVAQVASHTIQRAVRATPGRRFVAVTCHYDVLDWLQPDWVYDVAAATFAWRLVQPHPRIDIAVHVDTRAAWPLYSRHHYLSGEIHSSAKCYTAWIAGRPVAFAAIKHFPHPSPKARNIRQGHRLVVLPDYQGLGIAGRLDDWLGEHLYSQGMRYHNTVSHPAMIRHYAGSPRWRELSAGRVPSAASVRKRGALTSSKRSLASASMDVRRLGQRSFEYVPSAR